MMHSVSLQRGNRKWTIINYIFLLDLSMLKLVKDVISEGALVKDVARNMRTCRCAFSHFTASKPMIKP